MGTVGTFLPLFVAISHQVGGCWAGPISLKAFRDLKHSEEDMTHRHPIHSRNVAAIEPGLWPRSPAPGTNHSIWAVIAIVAIILLICLLLLLFILWRRSRKKHQKSASDEELGFGQNPGAQAGITPPPKAYDGVPSSQSPPPKDMVENSRQLHSLPPPPLLTVSPPDDSELKPRRVPVPHLSALPRLNGLPASPRLIGLPPSPRLPTSPARPPRPSLKSPSSPSDFDDILSSPQGLASPAMSHASASALDAPLSAGGLERMMTQMEIDLRVR